MSAKLKADILKLRRLLAEARPYVPNPKWLREAKAFLQDSEGEWLTIDCIGGSLSSSDEPVAFKELVAMVNSHDRAILENQEFLLNELRSGRYGSMNGLQSLTPRRYAARLNAIEEKLGIKNARTWSKNRQPRKAIDKKATRKRK